MSSNSPSPVDSTSPADAVQNGGSKPSWGLLGTLAKFTAVIAFVLICGFYVRKKLSHLTWDQLSEGFRAVSWNQIILALLVTSLNFLVLTGYDWISVHYLKKKLPLRKIMVGAIIGYAFSNVLGWMIGGTAVRFRLYTRWGFSMVEVIALISILSVTFWLGMFLLAGIAFVLLPVHLPVEYAEKLYFSPLAYGYFFLFCVLGYLAATLFVKKPLKLGNQQYSFPPFKLSLLQLSVSATDFALASLVLYLLLPAGTANYSDVLVSYLAAMIVTVFLHIPGGVMVLELTVLEMLSRESGPSNSREHLIFGGVVMFRVVYYLLPALFALVLYAWEEFVAKHPTRDP